MTAVYRWPVRVWRDAGWSWDQLKRGPRGTSDDAEVTVIERRNPALVVALRERDDAGIGGTEGEVDVLVDEISGPAEVSWREKFHGDLAIGDRSHERRLSVRPQLATDQVGALRHHQRRRYERCTLRCDQSGTALMGRVGLVRRGQQHAGVNDQHNSVASEALGEHLVRVGSRSSRCRATDPNEARPPVPTS